MRANDTVSGPDNPATPSSAQLQQHLEAVAQLAHLDLPPASYYAECLRRVSSGTAARAGAIWTCSGRLQAEAHANLVQVGLDPSTAGWQHHDLLLRHALQHGEPLIVPPHARLEPTTADQPEGGNPTDWLLILVPIRLERQVVGLVEVWQEPTEPSSALSLCVSFLTSVAQLAASYVRNQQLKQLAGQQQVWRQIEEFACQVHASLRPAATAYCVANDGCRLVGCDRLSVALRQGRRTMVEAVSGVDVIEQRSQLMRQMTQLCSRVLDWGERLSYSGSRDSTLPAAVLQALDAYLAVSGGRILFVLPLRSSQGNRPPIAALFLDCFEAHTAADVLEARLETVGRHAASALANAIAFQRIPLSWIGRPLARMRERTSQRGGLAAVVGLAALLAALVWVPYPLKLEAHGQLLPEKRCWLFTPLEAQVVRIEPGVQPGSTVAENQSLVLMYELQLELKLTQLANEVAAAQEDIAALSRQQSTAVTEAERGRWAVEKRQREFLRNRKLREVQALREHIHADEARPGYFWLTAPMRGTVLTWDLRENLVNRTVKPSEPLLRVGDKDQRWEVELKIPHKHIGAIVRAFGTDGATADLDVDLLLTSAPTRSFKGKLTWGRLAREAIPATDGAGVGEPVVMASVRIDGPDLSAAERVAPDLLITGTEVHCQVHCGSHALGYSLFHGLWMFVCEKTAWFWL